MVNPNNDTITAVPGIKIGHYTDLIGATGCTIAMMPDYGATAGVEVRGAAPGTRETDLLKPGTLVQKINAILLGGGSAYGLAAADGVMQYLEENNTGFQTRSGIVPIVPGAILFDLGIGNPQARPTSDDGYQAAKLASNKPVIQGTIGAGTGATVSKFGGIHNAIKGGLGSKAISIDETFTIGSLMVVNASGDIIDPETGILITGSRTHDNEFISSRDLIFNNQTPQIPQSETNTTIGIVATNIPLTVEEANRIAIMAHSGIARSILPSYGMGDGDTLFVVSTALESTPSPIDLTRLGTIAAWTVEQAILNAVQLNSGLSGIPSAKEYTTKTSQ
tara:strand:+ start:190 stop:1191 length:1002 start_codon:yes stop_codon:yes gene_type:complete